MWDSFRVDMRAKNTDHLFDLASNLAGLLNRSGFGQIDFDGKLVSLCQRKEFTRNRKLGRKNHHADGSANGHKAMTQSPADCDGVKSVKAAAL